MLDLGKYNTLRLDRFTSVGAYLEDEDGNDVLLPTKYIPQGVQVDDELTVFIYRDNEQRLIATSLVPKAVVGEFAYLEVNQINKFGAYLSWGIEKDLFVPFKEQAKDMEPGEKYVVFIYIDDKNDRLAASSKTNKYLNNEILTVEEEDAVDLFVVNKTTLGINVIVDNIHKGLIYHNEVFQEVRRGDKLPGYIKKIREGNKLDISLQKQGVGSIEPNAELILHGIENAGGFLPLHDKSSPEEIKDILQMSKKTFKRAIGMLYKSKMITITSSGIERLKK